MIFESATAPFMISAIGMLPSSNFRRLCDLVKTQKSMSEQRDFYIVMHRHAPDEANVGVHAAFQSTPNKALCTPPSCFMHPLNA